MPLWPEGVVGSLTHSGITAVAAVGRRSEITSVGIDLQEIRLLRSDIAARIALPSERAWVTAGNADATTRALMLFSAKESVFKALYPIVRRHFGFHAVELHWNPERESFRAEVRSDLGSGIGEGVELPVQVWHLGDAVFTLAVYE